MWCPVSQWQRGCAPPARPWPCATAARGRQGLRPASIGCYAEADSPRRRRQPAPAPTARAGPQLHMDVLHHTCIPLHRENACRCVLRRHAGAVPLAPTTAPSLWSVAPPGSRAHCHGTIRILETPPARPRPHPLLPLRASCWSAVCGARQPVPSAAGVHGLAAGVRPPVAGAFACRCACKRGARPGCARHPRRAT